MMDFQLDNFGQTYQDSMLYSPYDFQYQNNTNYEMQNQNETINYYPTLNDHQDEKKVNVDDGVTVEFSSDEVLFNRLQWYFVTAKFRDLHGNPALVNRQVRFEEDISFFDRRKALAEYSYDDNSVLLGMKGLCEAGDLIRKCERCKEKDKNNTMSKRKRGTNNWSEDDEVNNCKLIQVVVNRNEEIDSNGCVTFRIRIGCCVGVNKQHHVNHVGSDDDAAGIHRGCSGIQLVLNATINSVYSIKAPAETIRVLGKIKKSDNARPVKKRKIEPRKQIIPPVQHNEIVGIPKVMNTFTDNTRSIFSILEKGYSVDPSTLLQNLVNSYQENFGKIFGAAAPELFSGQFFSNNNLNTIEPESPMMLEVLSIVACGACCYDFCVTDNFFRKAMDILSQASIKQTNFRDALLFADGLCKISMYYGALGNLETARYYSSQSFTTLSNFIEKGYHELADNAVYENAVWTRASFFMDAPFLNSVLEWALERDKYETVAYIAQIIIIEMMIPDIKYFLFSSDWNGKSISNVAMESLDVERIIYLVNLIRESLLRSKDDMESTYQDVMDYSLNSLIYLVSGNYEESNRLITKIAIKCALREKKNQLSCWIPVMLSAFVAFILVDQDISKKDECELILKALKENCLLKWSGFFINFIAHHLNLKIPEPAPIGLSWTGTTFRLQGCSNTNNLVTFSSQ